MIITENFDSREFVCKCGCGLNNINPCIVNRLQVIRDIIDKKIIIRSGSRCAEHNKYAGGTNKSYHLNGKAIDWTIEGDHIDLAIIVELYLLNWSGGFHYYKKENFVHVDMGPRRRWTKQI